jgi:hypothetical protein
MEMENGAEFFKANLGDTLSRLSFATEGNDTGWQHLFVCCRC